MATFAATREIERTNTATKSGSKAWAWTGLAAGLVGILVTWGVQFTVGMDALESGGEPILDKLGESNTEALYRITSGLGFLVAAGLVFFGVGLWRQLQARTEGRSSIPTVILGSFFVTAATLAIAMSFRAQVMDGLSAYAADPSTHVMMNRLQQDSVLAAWATLIPGALAVAVGGIKGGLFSKGLGWFSAVMALAMIVFCMGGVPFPANVPALIWLLGMSVWSIRQPALD